MRISSTMAGEFCRCWRLCLQVVLSAPWVEWLVCMLLLAGCLHRSRWAGGPMVA